MRIAVFSDIHGNSVALDAVLEDIEASGGVDTYLILGDLIALGFDPIGVLERLLSLENAIIVRGNTDRYLITGERPSPTIDQVIKDPSLLTVFADVLQSFAWTHGAIASSEWMDWLRDLPSEYQISLPDGTLLHAYHSSPGRDDGMGIHPGLSKADLRSLFSSIQSGLVCVGHTHTPYEIRVDSVHVLNVGSVSNPFPPDLRASYLLIEAEKNMYNASFRYVLYDRELVIDEIIRVAHPTISYLTDFMRGKIEPLWKEEIKRGKNSG
jgi:putative phosphoesterase